MIVMRSVGATTLAVDPVKAPMVPPTSRMRSFGHRRCARRMIVAKKFIRQWRKECKMLPPRSKLVVGGAVMGKGAGGPPHRSAGNGDPPLRKAGVSGGSSPATTELFFLGFPSCRPQLLKWRLAPFLRPHLIESLGNECSPSPATITK